MTLSDDEIKHLQSQSEDALLADIGRAVVKNKGGLQARPPSIKKLIAEAKGWLDAENERIQKAVCSSDKIRAAALSEPGSTEKLLRLVADAVGSVAVYIPAGSLAEFLVRDGIPKYCKTIWATKS